MPQTRLVVVVELTDAVADVNAEAAMTTHF
jgi:hypothetical protein